MRAVFALLVLALLTAQGSAQIIDDFDDNFDDIFGDEGAFDSDDFFEENFFDDFDDDDGFDFSGDDDFGFDGWLSQVLRRRHTGGKFRYYRILLRLLRLLRYNRRPHYYYGLQQGYRRGLGGLSSLGGSRGLGGIRGIGGLSMRGRSHLGGYRYYRAGGSFGGLRGVMGGRQSLGGASLAGNFGSIGGMRSTGANSYHRPYYSSYYRPHSTYSSRPYYYKYYSPYQTTNRPFSMYSQARTSGVSAGTSSYGK